MNENTDVKNCTECPKLVSCRSRIVNGVGPTDTELVLVGEAPGKTEDETGEPFTGRSGSVLDEVLETSGFEREDVRITNCVRCRPPDNRDPHVGELENCFGYLEREIRIIDPDVVVPLGRIPTRQVISEEETYESVTEATGSVFKTPLGGDETVAVVSVHPAATLYNRDLRPAMEDAFRKAASLVNN